MARRAFKGRFTYGIWNRNFLGNIHTRLAYPWTKLFVAAGLSPNQVTVLSFVISLAAMPLLALRSDDTGITVLAGLMLLVGLWWDHSDGQVARATGKGSNIGGLLDTVIDRWVEAGWITALGIGIVTSETRQPWAGPQWFVLATVAAAVFGIIFLRWMLVQSDLYKLREQLLQARAQDEMPDFEPKPRPAPGGRTFYLPFSVDRDFTMTSLFVITMTPYWVWGLGVFAAIHAAVGVEKAYYAMRDLQRGDQDMLGVILRSDYHK